MIPLIRRIHLVASACAWVLGLGVGCGVKPPEPDAPVAITFVTDWKAQAEHGGFYQAKAKGFYAARGLDVTIRPGGVSVNPPQLIAAGAVDFAMGSNGFQPLNLVAAGADVRAVAALFQKDPQVLITHPRADIHALKDMKGHSILISDASFASWWNWLAAKYEFSDDQVRKYTFNLAPFLTDPQAIQQGYVSSEPYLIRKEGGFEPQVFMLADDGYPSYSTMILARGSDLLERDAIVRAFVAASIDGWRSYLHDDPAPGNALIRADNPEMSEEMLAHGIEAIKRYGLVESGDASTLGIGAMTEQRWSEFFSIMSSQGVYPPSLDWKRAFTTDYLPPATGVPAAPEPG